MNHPNDLMVWIKYWFCFCKNIVCKWLIEEWTVTVCFCWGPCCFSLGISDLIVFRPRFNIKSLFHLALYVPPFCVAMFLFVWSPRNWVCTPFVNAVCSLHSVLHPFSLYFVWSHSFSPFAFLGVCCPAFFQVIRITVSFHWIYDSPSLWTRVALIQWTFGCNRRDLQFMNASNECNFLYFLSLRHLPWVLPFCCMHWKVVFGEVVVFWRMATPENGFCCVLVCFCCMNRGGVIYPFSLSFIPSLALSLYRNVAWRSKVVFVS